MAIQCVPSVDSQLANAFDCRPLDGHGRIARVPEILQGQERQARREAEAVSLMKALRRFLHALGRAMYLDDPLCVVWILILMFFIAFVFGGH